jgi:hypothetical protein
MFEVSFSQFSLKDRLIICWHILAGRKIDFEPIVNEGQL